MRLLDSGVFRTSGWLVVGGETGCDIRLLSVSHVRERGLVCCLIAL